MIDFAVATSVLTAVGILGILCRYLLERNWGHLLLALTFLGFAVQSVHNFLLERDPAWIAAMLFDLTFMCRHIYMWWKDGGGDDFKKRKRQLSAKLKAKFRMIKSFQPKLAPAPVPT